MAEIKKGRISTLDAQGTTAAAVIDNAPGAVSSTLIVPFYLLGCLEIGMQIAFVEFEDCTGLVLARMDGEWNHDLKGSVNVEQNVTAADVITSTASFNAHTHTGVHGETSTAH